MPVDDTAIREQAQAAKPIGFVARRLDETVTEYVGNLLAGFGAERRHWQMMRRVHEQPGLAVGEYVESARVFYAEESVLATVEELRERGWLAVTGSGEDRLMTLTAEGESTFSAMAAEQEGTWDRMLDGLSYADYLTVVRLLEAMTENLERHLPAGRA
ncbi:MarR family winged helix-turn-helix transcriptional regulator [Pseudonocardia endophytica]|uniref:DNA-binding MarR family transcriptional regulator n=1 Tax=Pseudonocardia endophytica TaxID=401976 RepID=A0A4V2PHX2_PSEEN|nr:hypothetical protein [Pseudonocardia endophytica]TCK22446.1 hypothetical protein EV378_6449 [Pseudonocardia endophytica]